MALEQVANFGETTVNEALDNSETTVTVTLGSVFPSSGNFRVLVDDEIMLVTSRSTNDLTVTRGAESTSAVTHSNGATITMVLTAASLQLIHAESQAIGARAWNSGTQDIVTATWTALTFDEEEWDTDAIHSVVSNTERLTVPANMGGKWLICAGTQWAANVTGVRLLEIRQDGSTDAISMGQGLYGLDGSVASRHTMSVVADLAAAAYIEAWLYQDSGGNLAAGNATQTGDESFLSMHRLG